MSLLVPVPAVFKGALIADVPFDGFWTRFLVWNFDNTQNFFVKVNGSSEIEIPAGFNYGDHFPRGILNLTLVWAGNSPAYQVVLHV